MEDNTQQDLKSRQCNSVERFNFDQNFCFCSSCIEQTT